LTNAIIKAYFDKKINGYKKQDQEAKRTINKEQFVNQEWLMTCINQLCFSCNIDLFVDVSL
jgi:hypothetical protein